MKAPFEDIAGVCWALPTLRVSAVLASLLPQCRRLAHRPLPPFLPALQSPCSASTRSTAMLLLFESSAGFCLFKVLDEGKLKQAETEDVWSDFETPEKASKVRPAGRAMALSAGCSDATGQGSAGSG